MNNIDKFAAYAMVGICQDGSLSMKEIAQQSYELAELMMIEKAKNDVVFAKSILSLFEVNEKPAAPQELKTPQEVAAPQEPTGGREARTRTFDIRKWGERKGISKRHITALERQGILTLSDLNGYTLRSLHAIDGAGRGFISSIHHYAKRAGINLAKSPEDKAILKWAKGQSNNKKAKIQA